MMLVRHWPGVRLDSLILVNPLTPTVDISVQPKHLVPDRRTTLWPGLAQDGLWLYYPYGNSEHQRVNW